MSMHKVSPNSGECWKLRGDSEASHGVCLGRSPNPDPIRWRMGWPCLTHPINLDRRRESVAEGVDQIRCLRTVFSMA